MNIAVFMGGSSPEREVSLHSGDEIVAALKKNDHRVIVYDVEWKGKHTLFNAVEECRHNEIDIVFLALHGGLGENGGVQGVLEAAGLNYTGTGITGSAVAMDKDISKKIFAHNGIPTARWIAGLPDALDISRHCRSEDYPCVVKPTDQGSTIGLTVVKNHSEIRQAIETAARYSEKIMIETYIPGAELTVPVLGDKALPVIEIRPSHDIYDYECKYTAGKTEYLVPAPITGELETEITDMALQVFGFLGLRDIARIDFRLDADGKPLCFEANTLPGMTATSLVPKSAKAAGIEFPDLVTRIAELAMERG